MASAQSPSYYRRAARNLCHRSKGNSMPRQQDEQSILVLCCLIANSQNSKAPFAVASGTVFFDPTTRATSSSRLSGEKTYSTEPIVCVIFLRHSQRKRSPHGYGDSKSRRVSPYHTQVEICLISTTLQFQKERRMRRDGIYQTLPYQFGVSRHPHAVAYWAV